MRMNFNKVVFKTMFVCCFKWMIFANSSNIMAIQTIGGRSHWAFTAGVLQILIDKGYNVTAYTPFPNGNRENYTEFDISNEFVRGVNVPLNLLQENFTNPYKSYLVLRNIGQSMCDKLYANTEIMKAFDRPSDFDLVITEPLWSDCVSHVAAKMNLPLLYVSAFSAISFKESSIAGAYSNPFEYTNLLLPHSYPTTISQKMENFFLFLEDILISLIDTLSRLICPKAYETSDPVSPSAVLVNSHSIIEKPRPGASKVFNVGGIHLEKPKPLPADIEEFINNSTNGVIYIAFGATLKMSSIPKDIFMKFIEALEQLPMNVLLKYEDSIQFNTMNIMARKWFPQRDVLVHPNVKLFISHGGMCGILETIDAAVPVVGVPIIGDQFRNIDNLVQLGMAVSVPFDTVTKENIFNNIYKVLNNNKYANNAKKASVLFKKSIQQNEETVVKLTEYAIHNKAEQPQKSNHWWILSIIVLILYVYYARFIFRIIRLSIKLLVRIFILISGTLLHCLLDGIRFLYNTIFNKINARWSLIRRW